MEALQEKRSTGQRWFVRPGRREDCAAVHALIVELAVYEREPDAVVVTVADLEADGFGPNAIFDLFVAEEAGEVIGMALVYEKYSTWKGRCLYLEDFVVTASRRGEGIGQTLFTAVHSLAVSRGVRRLEWQVLEWNKPAIAFYRKIGAELDGEWLNGRIAFDV
ncbi:GNAT family N-acetyltransferase [bacterium]|nr:GNAT family N-acetyltransferase [bacterium]